MGLREGEQAPDLSLGRGHRRGKHPTQALSPGGQQDVPDQRVHRGTGNQADSVHVFVHGGHGGQVHGDHEEDRHVAHVVEQGELVGRGGHRLVGVHVGRNDGVEWGLSCRRLGGVEAQRGSGQLAEPLSKVPVADHHHVGALSVAARRGEPGRVEDPVQLLVGDRLVGELATGKGGAHGVEQVHGRSLGGAGRGTCRWADPSSPQERHWAVGKPEAFQGPVRDGDGDGVAT